MTAQPLKFLNDELLGRTHSLNQCSMNAAGRYVLVWLQQTLRGEDNPAIDVGVQIANQLGLPVLVYHGLREDYPYASARLHSFILGASRAMAQTLANRDIAYVQHIVRPAHQIKGLVYQLAEPSACVVTDAHATFVGNWQANIFASKTDRNVLAVDATRLVPHKLLPTGLNATKAFRAAHSALREKCLANRVQVEPVIPAYDGAVPFKPDVLAEMSDEDLAKLVAECRIDHSLPLSQEHPATRETVEQRLKALTDSIIGRYKWARNNPADEKGSSQLSPYLHFGMTSPFAIMRAINAAEVTKSARYKFVDELLTWREWCHWRVTEKPELVEYSSLPTAARKTLEDHASDAREVLSLTDLIHGTTPDETWNAAQRQWLKTGWMHNNLRMYWAKQIMHWTPSPEIAWATACYLNDRLSLDGRDPATYVMMRWAFGEARPAYREQPVYGWVSTKNDSALRKRIGMPEWLRNMASSKQWDVAVPDDANWSDMYLGANF